MGMVTGVLLACAVGLAQEPAPDGPPPPPGSGEGIVWRVLQRFPDIDRQRVRNFLDEQFSDEVCRFRELSVRHYDEAAELMSRLVEEALEFMEARHTNPERYRQMVRQREMEKQAMELAEALREAEGDDRDRLSGELRRLLEESFDLKQDRMRGEVDLVERELDELKTLVTKREENRDSIIERRLGELMGDTHYLEW